MGGNYREEPGEPLPGEIQQDVPASEQIVDSAATRTMSDVAGAEAVAPRMLAGPGGGVIPPPARTAGATIDLLEDGQLSADLQEELRELVAQMKAVHNSTRSKVKGEATLNLKFEIDASGAIFVEGKTKIKAPDLPRKRSIVWTDDQGNFTRFPPNQTQMFGSAPIRRVG